MSFKTYLSGSIFQYGDLGIKVISSMVVDNDDILYIYSTNNNVTSAGGCDDNVYQILDFDSTTTEELPIYINNTQYQNSSITTPVSGTGFHAGMVGNGICLMDDMKDIINTMYITLSTATGEDGQATSCIMNEPQYIESAPNTANYFIVPSVPTTDDPTKYMNCLGNMISLPNSINTTTINGKNNTKMVVYMVPEYGVYTSSPRLPLTPNPSVVSVSSKLLIPSDTISNQYPISIARDTYGNIYVGTTNITDVSDITQRTNAVQSITSYSLSPNPIDASKDTITANIITTFEQPPLLVVKSSTGNWTSITVTSDDIVYALYEVPQDDISSLIQGYILQYTIDGKYIQLIKKLPIVQPYKIFSPPDDQGSPIPIKLPSFTFPISSLVNDSQRRLYFTESYVYDDNSPSNVLIRYTPPSDSNICFPGKTPIVTDMGIVNIEDIDIDYHTIRDKKIVALTKTKSQDNYLVCFEKNSLGEDCPSDKTIMSSEHRVLYKDNLIQAKKLVGHHSGIKKVKYNGQTLYNILLEDYSWVMVNDMVCETLHPENEIAKWYLSDLPELYKNKIITVMNYASSKKDYTSYKKATSCLDF